MRKIKYLVFVILFSFNFNYTTAQCTQQRVYSCSASQEGSIYLNDFNTRLKVFENKVLTGDEWTVVLNKGTYYRFGLCTPRGREDDVEFRLFNSKNAEFTNPIAISFLTDIGTHGFDFYCTESGIYNVSVRFKYSYYTRRTCGIGMLLFIGRKEPKNKYYLQLNESKDIIYYSLDEFANNEKAENLYLANTDLKRFPRKIMGFTNLKELYIGENHFKKLNKNIYKLQNLKYIDLSFSPKLNFEKTFILLSKIDSLEELGLSHNIFKHLPSKIVLLQNLQKIHLPCNKDFDYKNASILLRQLPKLKSLKLNSTDYHLINRYLSVFTYFEEIDLSGCYLRDFPTLIFHTRNLKSLNLSNNRLMTIPPGIIKFRNLTKLNLSNNLLTEEVKENLKILLPNCDIVF